MIDFLSPVRNTPLNRGLVGWWLAIPSWNGRGQRLPNLVANGRSGRGWGLLQNMEPADWLGKANTHPGGFGALAFDGSNENVAVGEFPIITSDVSAAFWLRTSTTVASEVILGFYAPVGGSFVGWGVGFNILTTGKVGYWSEAHGSWVETSSSDYNSGDWVHVCFSLTNTTCRFYQNGRADGSATSARPSAWSALGDKGRIASFSDDSANFIAADLNDIRIWTRGITPFEAYQVYLQSSHGWPHDLKRIGIPAGLDSVAAGNLSSIFDSSIFG